MCVVEHVINAAGRTGTMVGVSEAVRFLTGRFVSWGRKIGRFGGERRGVRMVVRHGSRMGMARAGPGSHVVIRDRRGEVLATRTVLVV